MGGRCSWADRRRARTASSPEAKKQSALKLRTKRVTRGESMRSKALIVIVGFVLAILLPGLSGLASGQEDEGGGRGGRGGQNQAPPPAPETEATAIAGVVAA